jgi:hypothetical protein
VVEYLLSLLESMPICLRLISPTNGLGGDIKKMENETNNQVQNQVQATMILSEEAKQKLIALQAQVQEHINRSEISDYIKFKGGDRKILRFKPERTKSEYISYNENQESVLQYKLYASELLDEQQDIWTKVREWTISPKWANLVIQLLLKDFLTLEVIRTGSDKNNTNYSVTPYLRRV